MTRLNMVSNLIDIDINLKKLQFQKQRQQSTLGRLKNAVQSVTDSFRSPFITKQRLMLKSDLMELFKATESDALEYFYLQAASFRLEVW